MRQRSYWLLLILALQALLPAMAQHQLHAGNRYEESLQHAHVQLTQQILAVNDCAVHGCDPHDANEQHHRWHQDTQEIDLCLDCPCHGGHVPLPLVVQTSASLSSSLLVALPATHYFGLASEPAYRPPITAAV
ncbi:hypothetical protein [Shewanella sp.]|uniref:hypothetical protein n=1 Tax=Shewanella sp. TaxID=50422 RepID=UPI003A972272